MTDHAELIARAEASLKGVTGGPWVVTYERGCTHLRMGEKRDSQMCDETYYPWVPENLNDWEFIAASRQAVPDLIAALKASEARVEELESEVERLRRFPGIAVNAVMNASLEDHYENGGRIHFDDLQEFFSDQITATFAALKGGEV